jgi:hypothetical protein
LYACIIFLIRYLNRRHFVRSVRKCTFYCKVCSKIYVWIRQMQTDALMRPNPPVRRRESDVRTAAQQRTSTRGRTDVKISAALRPQARPQCPLSVASFSSVCRYSSLLQVHTSFQSSNLQTAWTVCSNIRFRFRVSV